MCRAVAAHAGATLEELFVKLAEKRVKEEIDRKRAMPVYPASGRSGKHELFCPLFKLQAPSLYREDSYTELGLLMAL